MPSFDVVSKLDQHEVDNAIQQAKKEVLTRFDFRDTGTEIDRTEEGIVIKGDSEGRVEAARKVFEEKLVRRRISLKALDPQSVQPAGGRSYRQVLRLKEGVETEKAKEIVKMLKVAKLRVQAAIQGDLVRVSGKKRDELQEAITLLRETDVGLPLQFINFRE
jgi:cyclic-di-GMP-binding protein